MRKASVARLFLLLFIMAFSIVTAPSYAFPWCPSASCGYYCSTCQEQGGTCYYSQYSGWCQDDLGYLRGHGNVSCTIYGMTYEYGECADW